MASHGYQDEGATYQGGVGSWMGAPNPYVPAPPVPPRPVTGPTPPTPPPMQYGAQPPQPYVYVPPSANVDLLLHGRSPQEDDDTMAPSSGAATVALPAASIPLSRASRAAVIPGGSGSNTSAVLRSQAPQIPDNIFVPRPPAYTPDSYDVADDEYEQTEVEDPGIYYDSQEPPNPPVKRRRKRRLSDILLLVLAILLIAGGIGYGVWTTMQTAGQVQMKDINGLRVQPDVPISEEELGQMDAKADTGLKFSIPAVNMNVPLGQINEVNNVINPPGFSSVYLIRNLGVSLDKADKGTVYAAAHSLRPPGMAPGNFVINTTSASIIVPVGSTINVGDRKYVMTASEIVDKNALGADEKLWANTPGMLVFITCLQYNDSSKYVNTGGHSPTNAVIIGKLVS